MKKLKNESGVALISLAVIVIVLITLSVVFTVGSESTNQLRSYNAVKEDIVSLSEEAKMYYLKNNSLPVDTSRAINMSSVPQADKNPNDSGNYYPIKLSLLSSGFKLEKGEGNKKNNFDSEDLYVLNEKSLTVYYRKGIDLNGKKHYTIVDDFQGGSSANEYYSKVDMPIISAVTMESSGTDKTKAGAGDKITLKILSNYNLTTKPTVMIDGTTVTCTWNGNVGTAVYSVASVSASKKGTKVSFSISNYAGNGKNGPTINEVTFGTRVSY